MRTESIPRHELAHLRHQLRTPLNHVIGYAEILLDDIDDAALQGAAGSLNAILTSARQILEYVQQGLAPPHGSVTEKDLQELRNRMLDPLQAIIRDVGLLAARAESGHLLDLLRINSAASELLSFAHGKGSSAPHAPARRETRHQSQQPLTAHVLLVDDDENNRDMLCRQLERIGCTVTTAEDGQDALSFVKRERFDLVLLDVIMPRIDGVAVLEKMRSGQEFSAVPVIMMSALDEMDSVRRCLELGAEDYLLKPFDPVLLRSRLTATLERTRLRASENERTKALEDALSQLREVNEDLQQFAYAASHDLQSPIRTVTTMSQLLSRQYKGKLDPEADELIDSITVSMRRMNELVADLLAYSKTSRRSDEMLAQFSLQAAVDAAMANLADQIEETGATVSSGPLPEVTGRLTQFVQLFQNLIGNALKYRREEPPRLTISWENEADECVVHVSDNGIGFDPAFAARIFEPFQRLHTHEYPGSGIGLAICTRIANQFGGRIWADSEVGKGSVFSFSIPASACRPTLSS